MTKLPPLASSATTASSMRGTTTTASSASEIASRPRVAAPRLRAGRLSMLAGCNGRLAGRLRRRGARLLHSAACGRPRLHVGSSSNGQLGIGSFSDEIRYAELPIEARLPPTRRPSLQSTAAPHISDPHIPSPTRSAPAATGAPPPRQRAPRLRRLRVRCRLADALYAKRKGRWRRPPPTPSRAHAERRSRGGGDAL